MQISAVLCFVCNRQTCKTKYVKTVFDHYMNSEGRSVSDKTVAYCNYILVLKYNT